MKNPENRNCVNPTWTQAVFLKLIEFKLPWRQKKKLNQELLLSEETPISIGIVIIKNDLEFVRD